MDRTTKVIFMVFSAFVMILMHWNMRQLSGVNTSCVQGHETTLTHLDDFKSSLLQSDLLVAFVDKSDLVELQKEKKEALKKVSILTSRLKATQTELAILKNKIEAEKMIPRNKSSGVLNRKSYENSEDSKSKPFKSNVDLKRRTYQSSLDFESDTYKTSQSCGDTKKRCVREKEFMYQAKLRLKHLRERIIDCERKVKKVS